jgi:hypothetical protein
LPWLIAALLMGGCYRDFEVASDLGVVFDGAADATTDAALADAAVVESITNGSFDDGMASWMYFTNGSGTFDVEAGYLGSSSAHVHIDTVGGDMQLFQMGISLLPQTHYHLSFAARCSSGDDLQVAVLQHVAPYTGYGVPFQQVDLTTDWQVFTIDFVSMGFSTPVNDARLTFVMSGLGQAADDYWIDQVSLTTTALSGG